MTEKYILGQSILGIAIRLSYFLRDREKSSYTLFFKKTLAGHNDLETKRFWIFPTNLKIQLKYQKRLERILFFTPDLKEFYEGYIFDIFDRTIDGNDDSSYQEFFQKIVAENSSFTKDDSYKIWFVIEDLKKIKLSDIQNYYVYGTDYALADKMMEPAFPRIYYTDTVVHRKKGGSLCPYCGKKLSPDFLYCPYCGSSLRILKI